MKRKHSKDSSDQNTPQTKRIKTSHANSIEKAIQEDIPGFRYTSSKYDQLNKVRVAKVNVLQSKEIKGLFATEDIPEGMIIGQYSGDIFDATNQNAFDVDLGEVVDTFDYNYTVSFEINGKMFHIDGSKSGGYTQCINHSKYNYNCIYDRPEKNEQMEPAKKNKPVIVVRTTKPVKKGEQFLAIYTPDYTCDGMLFLNKDDTDQSASEYYTQHKKAYSLTNLYHDERVFLVPDIYDQLSKNVKYNQNEINLYILPYNKEEDKPYEYSEYDRISLLMQACLEGNYSVVKKLVQEGVNLNQQQNHSGNCALHFAINGYRKAINKDTHTDIMIYLIKHGAKLKIQNAEKLTFLHEAIRYLLWSSFERVLMAIPKKKFAGLIQDSKDDFIQYGLRYERLDNFQKALNHCSNYTFFINPPNPEKRNITPQELSNIVQNYTPQKFKQLCLILKEKECNESGIKKLGYHFDHIQKEKNYIDLTLWGKKKSDDTGRTNPDVEPKKTQDAQSNSACIITLD